MNSNPQSWLDRLLGVAITMFIIAVLLYFGVHMVMAVAPVLLVVAGIVAFGFIAVRLIRHHNQNRYW